MNSWVRIGQAGTKPQDYEQVVTGAKQISGILDNHDRGAIGSFLRDKLRTNADLSFVSAYRNCGWRF